MSGVRIPQGAPYLEVKSINSINLSDISLEQLSLIEINLKLSVDERIDQLQSALNLIEEMRSSLVNSNEN